MRAGLSKGTRMKRKREELETESETKPNGDLEIRARGKKADEIMEARARSRATISRDVEEPRESEDKLDKIIKLLDDARNSYVVRRMFPKTGPQGENIATEVMSDTCPVGYEDLKRELFAMHGGHKFQIRILDSNGKPLDAIVVTNPDTKEPLLGEFQIEDGRIPTDQEIRPDALEAMDQQLEDQLRLQQKRVAIEEKKKILEEMRGGGQKPVNNEVGELKKQIEDLKNMITENAKDAEIRRLNAELDRQKSGVQQNPEITAIKQEMAELKALIVGGGAKKEDGLMLKLFEMVKDMSKSSSDAIAGALRDLKTTIAPTDKAEDLDSLLEKLVKLQGITGNKTGNKLDQIQEMILDTALQKFMGTEKGESADPDEPEDFGKFALRELMPVIKDLARGAVEKERKDGRQLSRQEVEAIIAQQAQVVAADIVRKQQMGQLPTGRPAPVPQPQPPRPPAGTTPPPIMTQPLVTQPPVTPPSAIPQVDRKQAVNYVLNTLQGELAEGKKKGQYPEESYAAGDALDTWPDDLLDMMLDVTSGEELKTALSPYADPVLLDGIINATKDDKLARKWLQDIFIGLREEWEEEKKATGRGRPLDGPDAPPAEKF